MNRIHETRERFGLSQHQLADLLGVAQPTISRWETGIHMPTKRDLLALEALVNKLDDERRVPTPSPALPAGGPNSQDRRPVTAE